eukprot:6969865-Prymnesium_polylepis.1
MNVLNARHHQQALPSKVRTPCILQRADGRHARACAAFHCSRRGMLSALARHARWAESLQMYHARWWDSVVLSRPLNRWSQERDFRRSSSR